MLIKNKVLLIASDHNGNDARDYLVPKLQSAGYTVVDMGPRTNDRVIGLTKVDYTDYAEQVAYAIQKDPRLEGILICGTGVGMSIAANRFKGVKASLIHDVHTAKKTREHNDSNVLVMGSWELTTSKMEEVVEAWLDADFTSGRHEKRVAKLDNHTDADVVLVPGVFELLHPGHIKLFEFAASLGKVVVALNSDQSALTNKSRPVVVSEKERMMILQQLSCVDEVIIMDHTHAGPLIEETGARYVVKGGTPVDRKVVQTCDNVPSNVEVMMFPLDHNYSSEKLRGAFRDDD